jgi:hypothetical protein
LVSQTSLCIPGPADTEIEFVVKKCWKKEKVFKKRLKKLKKITRKKEKKILGKKKKSSKKG